jgi:hypothetical protein
MDVESDQTVGSGHTCKRPTSGGDLYSVTDVGLPKSSGWYCDIAPGTSIAWLLPEGNPLKAIPIICFAFLCHQVRLIVHRPYDL